MMGRPKFRETWCKLLDATDAPCVLHHKHNEERCRPAMGPNERVARNNCAGPHEYEATLQRIVKGERLEDKRAKAAPGVELGAKAKAGWADVAAASAKREAEEKAPKGRKKKGEQTRLKVDARDAVEVKAKHELHRDMTDDEWREQSEILAHDRVELMTLEEEIAALKRKHAPRMKVLRENTAKGARQCNEKRWLSLVDCIEVHDVNRRCVTVYADVNGVRGVVVRPERPMRDEEYQRAIKSSPFEPPDEGDAVPVDAEPLDEAIAEGPASEGSAAPGESEDDASDSAAGHLEDPI